jgi:hypothetical protein
VVWCDDVDDEVDGLRMRRDSDDENRFGGE